MPAAIFDITLEEDADLTYQFTYKDSDGVAIDVTNYGATIVLADIDGEDFYSGTDIDGVIQVGSTDGIFTLAVPATNWSNLDIKEGKWQLLIYKTSGDPTDSPRRLVEGYFEYSKSLL